MDKRREMYFRISLLVWVLLVNWVLQLMNVSWGWVIFISNILLFTMGGQLRTNFLPVEVGGLVGLVFAYGGVGAMTALAPVLGDKAAVMTVLAIVLLVLIVASPQAPTWFNNAGFAYFTCALIDTSLLVERFVPLLLFYGAGTVLVNGVAIGLFEYFSQPK